MDRVQLGRALGYGARHAAKALVQAADAATATPKSATRPDSPSPISSRTQPYAPSPTAPRTTARAVPARKSALHPLKRYSGTVLLQVVGTFFAVFAVLMAQNAWKLRGGLHQRWSSPEAQHLGLMIALFSVFAWFAVSSFVRARRVERS